MYENQINSTHKAMMDNMQQQLDIKDIKEGKRLFKDKTNMSSNANMYPVLSTEDGAGELFHRRATNDFRDKSKDVYVAPPVSKTFEVKDNFVHNQIANKNKVNVDHFKNIYNRKIFTDTKRYVIQQMHETGLDFRALASFKNALFDSEELEDNHLVSMAVWTELKEYEMQKTLDPVEGLILKEIQVGDKVNLMKFCDIVDLFFYLPMQKAIDKNDSKDVYFILSSNVYGGHTNTTKDQGGSLKKMLDLLWIKLDERFKGMAEAYRYFDVNFNNRVSFNEF